MSAVKKTVITEITPAVKELSTVTIVAPFQTAFEGVIYGAGEKATVPSGVATVWVLSGWAIASE